MIHGMRILSLAAALVMCFGQAWALEFETQSLDTRMRLDQPARVANLAGEPRLLLVGRTPDGEQQLQVYRLRSGVQPELQLSMTLSRELLAMDVVRIPGGEALCFLDPEGALCLDFPSGELRRVLNFSSLFRLPRRGSIATLDFMQDLNDDELDDLLVPDFGGLVFALQHADGSFSVPAELLARPEMILGETVVRYRLPRTYLADANFDGRMDVLVLEDRSLRVYTGIAQSGFDNQGRLLRLGLDIASDAQLQEWESDRGDMDQSDLSIRVIERVADLNGDGAPDVLTEATHSSGVFDKSSDFAVHLGRNRDGWVQHSDPPDSVMVSKGMQFDLVVEDLDGDGRKDLIIPSIRLGLGRVIKALFSGSISMDLNFYRADSLGHYPAEPNYSATTKVRIDMKKGHADVPAVLAADFSGDGIKDLLLQLNRDELKITLGDASESLFAGQSFKINASLPRNGDRVQPLDVDADGLSDLVIQYGDADGPELSGKLSVLLAVHDAGASGQ
jgi:hypothetical protein